jgi:DNA-binding MarR family transcriptional regulator
MQSRGVGRITSEDSINELGRRHHIGRLLLRAHRDFSSRAIDALQVRGYGSVTLAHLGLLPHLGRSGARVTTLAARAGMTKQGMGQLVMELERQGFLVREPDPIDKRAALVRFTNAGLRLLDDAILVTQEIEGEYARILGPDRLAELKQALSELVDP